MASPNHPDIGTFAADLARTIRACDLNEDETVDAIKEAFRSDGAVYLCDCALGKAERRVRESVEDVDRALAKFKREVRGFLRSLDTIIADGEGE